MSHAFDDAVTAALADLAVIARALDADFAIIGGIAMQIHNVPRQTLDVDVLIETPQVMLRLAQVLVEEAEWQPLRYSVEAADYVEATDPTVHEMDDPVLFALGTPRFMVPMRSSGGLLVDMLAAQHPIEVEVVTGSPLRRHMGVRVPVAPLGAVLLLKSKADRDKDTVAIEQAAELLPRETIEAAMRWANERDPGATEDLIAVVEAARARKASRPNPKWRPRG